MVDTSETEKMDVSHQLKVERNLNFMCGLFNILNFSLTVHENNLPTVISSFNFPTPAL